MKRWNLVGALTSKQYAFKARSWELQKTENIDFSDAFCVNIVVYTKLISKKEILRILPSTQTKYSHNWISDKTRFSFDGLQHNRIEEPKIGSKTVSWLNIVKHIKNSGYTPRATSALFSTKRQAVIFGNISDLKTIFFLSNLIKSQGGAEILYGIEVYKQTLGFSYFHTFNSILDSLENIDTFLIINSNLRYEASILNTTLRSFKQNKDVSCITLGNYSPLGYFQNHVGNSLNSLMTLVQNKTSTSPHFYKGKQISIVLGYENLKKMMSYFLQNLLRYLSKKTMRQTKMGSFFGILHADMGSLNFCYLGLQSSVRSRIFVKKKELFIGRVITYNHHLNFEKGVYNYNGASILALSSHTQTNGVANFNTISLPTKAFFEKQSFTFNVDQILKKSERVILNTTKTLNFALFLYL